MELEPVKPNLPIPARAIGGIVVVIAGFLLLKWVIGTIGFLLKVGVIIAIIAAVIWAGSKIFSGRK